jgi:hypothetical protein
MPEASPSRTVRVRVRRRIWAADDTYLVIPEIQVFERYGTLDGFEDGEEVEVTVRKLPKEEHASTSQLRRGRRRRVP